MNAADLKRVRDDIDDLRTLVVGLKSTLDQVVALPAHGPSVHQSQNLVVEDTSWEQEYRSPCHSLMQPRLDVENPLAPNANKRSRWQRTAQKLRAVSLLKKVNDNADCLESSIVASLFDTHPQSRPAVIFRKRSSQTQATLSRPPSWLAEASSRRRTHSTSVNSVKGIRRANPKSTSWNNRISKEWAPDKFAKDNAAASPGLVSNQYGSHPALSTSARGRAENTRDPSHRVSPSFVDSPARPRVSLAPSQKLEATSSFSIPALNENSPTPVRKPSRARRGTASQPSPPARSRGGSRADQFSSSRVPERSFVGRFFTDRAVNPLKRHDADTQSKVLLPDCPLKFCVDVATLLVFLLEYLVVLYIAATLPDEFPPWYFVAVSVVTVGVAAWIWTNTRTAVLSQWELEDTRAGIWKMYRDSWLVFDVLLTIPWDALAYSIAGNHVSTRVFASIRLLRLVRQPFLMRTANPVAERSLLTQFMNELFWGLAVIHLAACSWILVGTPQDQGYQTEEELRVNKAHQYISALYWSCVTISSTGYGDIAPSSIRGRILSNVWCCIGVVILVYIGAKVTQWMVVVDPYLLAEINKKRQLNSVMSHNKIPFEVQKNAISVFRVVLETASRDYNEILNELPRFLQDEIRLHIKLRLISQAPLFRKVARDCLTALAQVMIQEWYSLDENIIEYGQQGSEMFFLGHGIVEIYTYGPRGEELWMTNLKGGSFFGEIAIMSDDCTRTATVRAVTCCTIYTLTKDNFTYICSLYPDLKAKVEGQVQSRLETITENIKALERVWKVAQLSPLMPNEKDTRGKRNWKKLVSLVLVNKEKACGRVDATAAEAQSQPALNSGDATPTDSNFLPKVGTFVEPLNYHTGVSQFQRNSIGSYESYQTQQPLGNENRSRRMKLRPSLISESLKTDVSQIERFTTPADSLCVSDITPQDQT
ncbi:Potassium channel KOR1 [Diplonema papillatum]|nr:Potassium channel KOR1 [Diplonema papillatum]